MTRSGALAVFLASAGALVVEIAAARLLAPHVGVTVHVWTGVIAAVLLGLSLGGWIGGRLAEGPAPRLWLMRAFALAAASNLAALAAVHALGPAAGRGALAWPLAIVLLSLPFAVPSFFAGLVKPIATKLAVDAAPARTARILGAMYAAGALGAVAGTLASGFVLISFLALSEIVLAVAALFAIMAIAVAFGVFRDGGRVHGQA